MINIVINKERVNIRESVYSFYYLTKDIDEEISYSVTEKEGYTNIFYGFDDNNSYGIHIPCFFNKNYHVAFSSFEDTYFMHDKGEDEKPYTINEKGVIFGFDIAYSTFYLLTCKEEYEISKRDDKERFLANFSYRKDYIDVPFVQVNQQILYKALEGINYKLKLLKREFEVFLTHDVDSINSRDKYVFLHNAKDLLTNRNKKFSQRLNTLIKEIVKNQHLQIMNYYDIEKSFGARSEFYFIQGKEHRLGKRYELDKIKPMLDKITAEGWICGIHTNFFSYKDTNSIKEEINSIERVTERKVISCRNHYLRFETPTTWHCLSDAGIRCDSTTGYSDRNGLRAGTIRGFVPFDINSGELINLYEVPLIVMDGIVMETNASLEEKWQQVKKMLELCYEYKGSASVLWHQRMTCYADYKEIYIRILQFVKDKGGKFTTSDQYINSLQKEYSEILAIIEKLQK